MTRPSWIGQTLGGRYRIDDLLGQGGMSAVYKAYDPNLKRVVAVKMIHAHLAEDPKFLIRFEEEAAAVAQLRHPNIVQVFDFNHDDNLYYMVQEFVPGETLQDALRRLNANGKHMPLRDAIHYISNICDATHFAHQRGLIHRDIKPANVMINIHGQAILMDFGIVKITGGEKHTATGAVIGTAQYLAPEAIRGEIPDARSDMYSLAVTLFEMVSGKPPFEADSAMTLMMMHLNEPLPDLRQLRPDVPEALLSVLEKALAKDRDQRYASMAEFGQALNSVLPLLDGSAQASQPTRQPAAPAMGLAGRTISDQAPAASNTVDQAPAPIQTQIEPPSTPTVSPTTGSAHSPADQPGVAPTQPKPRSKGLLWGALAGAGLLGLAIIAVVAVLILRGTGNLAQASAAPSATSPIAIALQDDPTNTPAPEVVVNTTPTATLTPTIASTLAPSPTPTITPSPTPTIPAGVPYVRINDITVNQQGYYVVEYETFEYTEILPGQHVHFFFNTVEPEQAGVPGSGPWKLYGGPRPFVEYRTTDRPASTTQMCALVANPDHSIRLESGTCYTLPDVPAAVPVFNDPCLSGPGPAYPILGRLEAGQVLLVTGLSPDEAWWTVAYPGDSGETCWLPRSRADFSGDISTLPLAEVPPMPDRMSVEITGISLNAQNHYVVEFVTSGFTPALPGTHMHFFFDIYAADQLSGMGSNRLMYGGASPFTGYTAADRPQGATQLCVLVANPNHTVIPDSGSCYALP